MPIFPWTLVTMLGFERISITFWIILSGKLQNCTYYVHPIEKRAVSGLDKQLLWDLKNITYSLLKEEPPSLKKLPMAWTIFFLKLEHIKVSLSGHMHNWICGVSYHKA